MGPWSRRRTNCWRGDRWHSVQRVRLWSGLRLLWRTGVRLLWRTRGLLRRVRPRCLRRLRSRLLRSSLLRSSVLRSSVLWVGVLWPSVLSGLVIAKRDPLSSPDNERSQISATFFVPDLGLGMTSREQDERHSSLLALRRRCKLKSARPLPKAFRKSPFRTTRSACEPDIKTNQPRWQTAHAKWRASELTGHARK